MYIINYTPYTVNSYQESDMEGLPKPETKLFFEVLCATTKEVRQIQEHSLKSKELEF